MRLYTVTDISLLVLDALRQKGFSIIVHQGNGVIEVAQRSGIVSQHFTIAVKATDEDPV